MANEIEIKGVEGKPEYLAKPPVDDQLPKSYQPNFINNVCIPIPISCITSDEVKDATLTLVMSDLHAGDSDFLPRTLASTVENLKFLLDILAKKFNIKNFIIVLNGDMVSGREVYRYQHLRNIIQRGHWQVELAAQITKDIIHDIDTIIPVSKTFVIRGNHENRAENYSIYLTKFLDNVWYAGHHKVLNIAYPIGDYNVLFTHGMGSNAYYPVSYGMVRDCWKAFNQYRLRKIHIEEIAVGHTHWLQPRLELEGLTFNVTGGFQRWEKTISQRPAGMLLFLHVDGSTSVIPVKPDPVVENEEKAQTDLEFTNMAYYSKVLNKAIEKYSKKPEEIVL